MRRRSIFLALAVIAVLFALPGQTALSGQANEPAQAVEAVANSPTAGSVGLDTVGVVKSQAWGKIDFNSRRLTNNVWGAPAGEALTSGIYLNPDKGFGWYWHRNDPRPRPGEDLAKPIYPSVRIGGSPWETSNTALFPVKIRDLKTLKFDTVYDYPTTPTGRFNLAYDFFLSDTDRHSDSPKPKAEVMVWLHSTFQEPPETYKGDYSDGDHTYELYSWTMRDGRLYYAFVRKSHSPLRAQQTTVNAKKLLDTLRLDPGWYIHGIELGNEIVDGSGKIEIDRFSVNVNGTDL